MKSKTIHPLLIAAAFLCCTTGLSAKSAPTDNGSYTTKDKEYYLTAEQFNFIRPGLNVEVLEATIPGDLQPLVKFSIKDPAGLPLDIDGIYTPGPVDMRFMLTFIPQFEEQKVRLTESSRDRDGTFEKIEDGIYTYKFSTVLPDIYDQDATHTLALVGRRDLREFDLGRYVDNELYNFVPSGMYDPSPRDVVTTETCNSRCHDPLAMHGGRYREVAVCTQCHNPALADDDVSYSLDVLIHRLHNELGDAYPPAINDCEVCHTGGTPTENFPLVANPSTVEVCDMSRFGVTELAWRDLDAFEIHVGSADGPIFASASGTGSQETGKWVGNGTMFYLVDKATGKTIQKLPVNTTVLGCIGNAPGTPRGFPGKQHTNWLDHPSRLVCSSCHEDVNFETGEGHSVFKLIQTDDSQCGSCHQPVTGYEFDFSISGSHTVLYKSAQFPGVLVKFIDITNTNPGEKPMVTFTVGSKNGALHPEAINRLRFKLSGPNDDFSFYASEDVEGAVKSGDSWTYTFDTAIPEDAEGSYTISVEARDIITVNMGDEVSDERDTAENTLMAFAVTDTAAIPRRSVVSDEKCENCHSNLAFHGGNRHDPDYCVVCHMPESISRDGEQTIHFKYMVHALHRGSDLENGFAIGRHDYSEFEFPAELSNCDNCHVNDSQQLPLPQGLLPTNTPQAFWDPTMPSAAACLSCHDSDSAAAHAYTNTTFFGESCATCHGENKEYSVDKVHAQ